MLLLPEQRLIMSHWLADKGFSHASVRGSAIRIAASVSRTTGSAHRLVIVTANAATTTMSRNYFKFGKQRGSREWGYMGVSNRLHQDVYEYDECFFDVTELSATSWSQATIVITVNQVVIT